MSNKHKRRSLHQQKYTALRRCILRRRTAAGAVTNGRCAVSAARIFQRLSGVNGKG